MLNPFNQCLRNRDMKKSLLWSFCKKIYLWWQDWGFYLNSSSKYIDTNITKCIPTIGLPQNNIIHNNFIFKVEFKSSSVKKWTLLTYWCHLLPCKCDSRKALDKSHCCIRISLLGFLLFIEYRFITEFCLMFGCGSLPLFSPVVLWSITDA